MSDLAAENGGRTRREQLVARTRLILVICTSVAIGFAGRELVDGGSLGARFAVRIAGIVLGVIALGVMNRRWVHRYAWPLALSLVSVAYLMTALAGMVSPTHEYVTTAVLFVGAALTTATVLPWGVAAQGATVLIGATLLGIAVLLRDGDLAVVATDPGAAVMMAFLLSLLTARELQRYRFANWRGEHERVRAGRAVRRMNARLEQRVAARTADLAAANHRLSAEIGERRRTAEALLLSQAQLADTLDNSTAIISLKDLDGRYLLVNREFERVFGGSRRIVLGRTDDDLFSAALAERLGERDVDVVRSGVPMSFEQELPVTDPARAYVCVKFPLRGADGAPYGLGTMATDITELKRLEEELRRHQDELAHVLRLHTIGEMAAALAHEINQPLCAITNYAQGAIHRMRGGMSDPETLLHAFEQIAIEGLRAGQILRGIRGLVRREPEAEVEVDVDTLAGDAVRVLEPQARQHGVSVRLESSGRLPTIHANPTQIEQVMVNLMLNGVQAVADTATARREVVVTTARSGDTIEVAVSDTGGGIAAVVEEQLFTPFVTTKARGLGLGLADRRYDLPLLPAHPRRRRVRVVVVRCRARAEPALPGTRSYPAIQCPRGRVRAIRRRRRWSRQR
jgi:PAS domain S-box-containing protein